MMRVLEPKQFRAKSKQPNRNSRFAVVLLIILCGASIIGYFNLGHSDSRPPPAAGPVIDKARSEAAAATPIPLGPSLRNLDGNGFKKLYQEIFYPNTQAFAELPVITGNKLADEHIRLLAVASGFRPTSSPVSAIVKTSEPLLAGETDDLLQPLAYRAWGELKAAARKENVPLTLTSAYRSPDWQRDLFTQRLKAQNATINQIADGQADNAVKATLRLTAVPGYSRHHTGYTVDLWCQDGSVTFLSSHCYRWIHGNNYLHAKEYGWIPSYPEGADEQGPEPEPWEYVWVGKTILHE